MLTFDTPGSFILTPAMYHYADSFIIEMWGAGGAGGCTYGGNSGAYIEAMIYTYQSNFSVVIGKGGYSNMSPTCSNNCSLSFQYETQNDGGYTSLTGGFVNFTANGGNGGTGPYMGEATTSILSGDTRTIIYHQSSGCYVNYYGCANYQCVDGASSTFGGNGGKYNDAVNMNGSFPGGGGSAAYVIPNGTCSMITIPMGGNGGIILYLSPKNQPDNIIINPPLILTCYNNIILTPDMYQYADNFIIKMWRAVSSYKSWLWCRQWSFYKSNDLY